MQSSLFEWFGLYGLVRFSLVWVCVLMFGFSLDCVLGANVGINVVQSRASLYRYVGIIVSLYHRNIGT